MTGRYAASTPVPVDKTKAEIAAEVLGPVLDGLAAMRAGAAAAGVELPGAGCCQVCGLYGEHTHGPHRIERVRYGRPDQTRLQCAMCWSTETGASPCAAALTSWPRAVTTSE